MKKRLLSLLCALALTTGLCRAAKAKYPDIAGDEWFVDAVEDMTEKGIMTGLEGGLFGPYEPVTRATVITVLWRLEGSPATDTADPFPDAEEDWYGPQAAWAKETGVASGYDDGSFGGRDLVTKEQLACFLYRYAQYKQEPLASGALGLFRDAEAISPWAEEAVRHAVGVGILKGNDKGTLEPQGIANRAALAVMLQRMQTPAVG
ncbi:MAG: S-layer homology domain-containing protein [Oscillospiraceae bacterium]|nr:S-layer homology domain-containing protein [Oscillospiraceae bacterium]